MIDQLAVLARGGVAMVIATHDSDVLEQLSTRALRVHDGRASAAGPPCPRPVGPATSAARPCGPAVVRLRQVSLRYGPNEVLRDVDLDLSEDETLGIVGASGAGKSSIARVIAGVAEPGSGTVTFDGKPLPALRKRSKQEIARVQYVWQEAASSFDARRTVLDQVSMTAVRLRGLPPAEARKEATELLAELELTREQFGRFPPGLSGGQLQRAAIVRALLARPRVLICDEVTTGLDQQLSDLILDRLDIYRARTGASLVSISHEPRTLAGRADRVVVVDRGRVAQPVASEAGRTGEEFPRSC